MNLTAAILGMFGCLIIGMIAGAIVVSKEEKKEDVTDEIIHVEIDGDDLGEMTVSEIIESWASCRRTKASSLIAFHTKDKELSRTLAQLEACGEVVEDLKEKLKMAKRPRTGRVVDDLME